MGDVGSGELLRRLQTRLTRVRAAARSALRPDIAHGVRRTVRGLSLMVRGSTSGRASCGTVNLGALNSLLLCFPDVVRLVRVFEGFLR